MDNRTVGWLSVQMLNCSRAGMFGMSLDPIGVMGAEYNWNWSAVVDGRIVTGHVPDDVPEFIDAVTIALLKGDPALRESKPNA